MKVLDLHCAERHHFEGWFASTEEFVLQRAKGQIECPMCGDTMIERLPSAARLNLSAGGGEPAVQAPAKPSPEVQVQARFMHAVKQLLASTEDVGDRFPEEARRIHYGETPERGIRGVASPAEAEALRDEGIELLAVPVPAALKGPVQ